MFPGEGGEGGQNGHVDLRAIAAGKNICMFEFPAFLPPTNVGLPMHGSI